MSIENILNNKECKLIFLKAIVLGINYGKSENANYYLESIEKEILKINVINEEPIITEKKNDIIQKYDNIILNLNNQKKYTLNLIQTLSSNNYGSNYSRINLLKNNLNLINYEIDKNKLLIIKENKKNNDVISNLPITNKKYQNPSQNNIPMTNPTIKQTIKPTIKPTIKSINNNLNNNLVNDLEKTLSSLSNMLIN